MSANENVINKSFIKDTQTNPRLIAFYLTQFHPTPENDLWWGKGFTEWTNVTKAQPLFEDHYQPHLPTDFGFYDLRVRETRHDQIKTAKQYGIDGFCYHYYWFSGKRILNAPLDDMLADPQSDMPFCLCWANENWTRRWDAADHEVLIAQKYAPDDDLNFIKSLVPFFIDPRYIKVDGAPFLIVYRPQHLPDAKNSVKIWRDYCASVGIPRMHIVCALTHGNLEYSQYGFDGGVEFPPHNLNHIRGHVDASKINFNNEFTGLLCQYSDIANLYLNRQYQAPNVYKTVFPSWDNTARTGSRAFITLNGTPANYEHWLTKTIEHSHLHHPGKERLVFINAWNEWAEGCHLEPDRKFGNQFLEATLTAKQGRSLLREFPDTSLPRLRTYGKSNLVHFAKHFAPDRIIGPSNWLGHAPFVYWITKITRPKVVVELGTATDGISFGVLNQAIAENEINAKLFGFSCLDSEDNLDTASYIKTKYPNATLISNLKNYCDSAFQFADGSVDILHFHDIRNAALLRETFKAWSPKLSRKAVVLIHNTNWYGDICDTHSFWEEIQQTVPSFHFLDSHGMGVLLIGKDREVELLAYNDEDCHDEIWLSQSSVLIKAGKRIELHHNHLELQKTVSHLTNTIHTIRNSKSWKITLPIRKITALFK